MATLPLNRGWIHLVKHDINPFIFIKFILYGKIDMQSEIKVSELTLPPNFSSIPQKNREVGQKLDFETLKTKNDVILANQWLRHQFYYGVG